MWDGKRWLTPEDAALYLGVRVDRLTRYVREGKIPSPSYQLGLRVPRWDRLALDQTLRDALHQLLEPPPKRRPTLAETELGRRQQAALAARRKPGFADNSSR
jgi:hypothetical protein